MNRLIYVFHHAPHGRSSGREGVDALLAASAYSENIAVVFMGDGVLQLLQGQETDDILSKDYAPMLKLLDLYDIDQVFVSQTALMQRGVTQDDLIIPVTIVQDQTMMEILHQADKVLSF
ncbi:sulfurtransferase complex subunit TusC [Vibrio sp. MEBiC08052]|uniref:sulfurtransferase complex subunit TusC n=1 Tax=Vibrio sp. MEBiC08052 TaxID=1761910 RepID=UPI0007407125|nr:sulfurtransferase complex subunit TusC [Vibrio sp. MEBiC08052]KUI97116.1 tRNA 5-methylaminomethyl-2-thiouridine synthase TusC [Vibrio sp. MEBiC08052]